MRWGALCVLLIILIVLLETRAYRSFSGGLLSGISRRTTFKTQAMTTFLTAVKANPLLSDWSSQPYGLPPFAQILPAHFKPAFIVGFDSQLAELKAIAENVSEPTFENTIAAFDRSGGVLSRSGMVFSNLCSSNSPPDLQAVQLETAPLLANHETKVFTFPGLFKRIDFVYENRLSSGLNDEQIRLVERVHLDFVRAGAKFSEEDQKRYGAIMEKLSTLLTTFQQNVMADESEVTIDLNEDEMKGCPEFLISAAKNAAVERNKADGVFVITLVITHSVVFVFVDNLHLRFKTNPSSSTITLTRTLTLTVTQPR